jgi:hypothetical protein
MAELLPGEAVPEGQDKFEVDRVRKSVADVYTFVRSQEFNRTIASYTLDHYIEFAKQRIKGTGRQVRSASGEVLDLRPTKLETLEKLHTTFQSVLEQARAMAETADDSDAEDNTGGNEP